MIPDKIARRYPSMTMKDFLSALEANGISTTKALVRRWARERGLKKSAAHIREIHIASARAKWDSRAESVLADSLGLKHEIVDTQRTGGATICVARCGKRIVSDLLPRRDFVACVKCKSLKEE